MAISIPEGARPLRRIEYDKLGELGMFEGEKVELLSGAIVPMSPIGAPHCSAVDRLVELLVLALHGRARIRVQEPFAAEDISEPEPDILVAPLDSYNAEHPSSAHLVIEVAESSLAQDRGQKARLYARCGVPEYWVVNVVARSIEVFREPRDGVYRSVVTVTASESISLIAFPDVSVKVSDVLV